VKRLGWRLGGGFWDWNSLYFEKSEKVAILMLEKDHREKN